MTALVALGTHAATDEEQLAAHLGCTPGCTPGGLPAVPCQHRGGSVWAPAAPEAMRDQGTVGSLI